MTDQKPASAPEPIIDARRREMAIEHLLFGTIRFVAQRHPDLLNELDQSVDYLWDKAHGGARGRPVIHQQPARPEIARPSALRRAGLVFRLEFLSSQLPPVALPL